MNVRKNVSALTNPEKTAYVNAILALKADTISPRPDAANAAGALNRYDVYAWIHMLVNNGAHRGAAFTPWHREFLRQFELELKAVSGNPAMTIPYWDFVEHRNPLAMADTGNPFTANFMGGMGTGADNRVETGQFAESAGLWVLNVRTGLATTNRRDNTTYLRRRTGQNPAQLPVRADLDAALPRMSYDTAPFAEGNAVPGPATIAASFRKVLEYDLHNGPHQWVGGNMMPSTSPNDPLFFLHHSNIDRIWAIWQQRLNGGIPNYQPNAGTPLHSLNSVMAMLESSFFLFPVLNRPTDVLDHKNLGYMYDVDLPIIDTMVTTLDFGTVEVGSTVQLPIPFTMESGRNMKFQIDAFGGAPEFGPPTGSPAFVNVTHTNGLPQMHTVNIELKATTSTGNKSGLVTINVYVNDTDRYYSNVAGDYLAGSWTVTLQANVVEEVRSAIALVLDKSYSMSYNDGTSITRFEMLENAIMAVRDLLASDDGVGMVYYDTTAHPQFGITLKSSGGATAINNALANPANDPSGSTAIGQGIIEGAAMLTLEINTSGTPYTNFGLLVMTDGNQNVPPYINSAPVTAAISGISQDIYAVGLGQQSTVSEAALNDISKAVLLTGTMTGPDRLFKLSKYFQQILVDIKKMDIVLDPVGSLVFGIKQQIEYAICEADIGGTVVVLSPLAPFIKVGLITPGGEDISGTMGNITHEVNTNNQIYRLRFPAIPDKPDESHAGIWKVRLQLYSKDEVKKLCLEWSNYGDLFKNMRRFTSVPYSVSIYTRSNLNFRCSLEKSSDVVGATVKLFADLTQYRQPISGTVWAEIQWPHGSNKVVRLNETAMGEFSSSFVAERSGIYQILIKANGRSKAGNPFTRETWRSISIYKRTPARPTAPGNENGEAICKIIRCLMSQDSVYHFLKKYELDPDALKKCLEENRPEGDKEISKVLFESTIKSPVKEIKENSAASSDVSASGQEDSCLESVVTAPELRKVTYPEPKIPEMSNMEMEMPAFKVNEKGVFEKVVFTFDESPKKTKDKKKK